MRRSRTFSLSGTRVLVVVSSALVAGGLSYGCSSSSTSGDTGATEAGALPDSAGGPGDAAPVDTGAQTSSCGAMTSDLCIKCCDTAHPKGAATEMSATEKCVCGPPVGVDGKCQAQCAATDCNPSPDAGSSVTGDPCDICTTVATDDGGACVASVAAACNADPDCVAHRSCTDQCP